MNGSQPGTLDRFSKETSMVSQENKGGLLNRKLSAHSETDPAYHCERLLYHRTAAPIFFPLDQSSH